MQWYTLERILQLQQLNLQPFFHFLRLQRDTKCRALNAPAERKLSRALGGLSDCSLGFQAS